MKIKSTLIVILIPILSILSCTIGDKDNTKVKKQMGLFLFIAITNLCLNALGMKTMVDFVGVNHLISQAIVSLGIAAWSFFAYSFIFKTK